MDMQEPVTSASERETLQEEIKRIQLALEGNYDDGSGDENGSNVSEDEDALNIDEDCEDNPNEEQYGMQGDSSQNTHVHFLHAYLRLS